MALVRFWVASSCWHVLAQPASLRAPGIPKDSVSAVRCWARGTLKSRMSSYAPVTLDGFGEMAQLRRLIVRALRLKLSLRSICRSNDGTAKLLNLSALQGFV